MELPERVKTVLRAFLDGEAQLSPSVRQELLDGKSTSLPAPLAAYADKVAHTAYKITDDDIAKLRAAGHDEDQIFEVTLAAALGAGLKRLRRGLSLLRGSAS